MSVDNKPENVSDPVDEVVESSEKVIQDRLAAGREEISQVSNLVPKDLAGGSADVTTQGDSSTGVGTNDAVLKFIENSTGRKFESVEEFNKHYSNLSGLVGDASLAKARKAAETLNSWEQKFGKSAPELEQVLASISAAMQTSQVVKPEQSEPKPVVEKPQSVKPSASNDPELVKRLELLEHDNQMRALEKKYPNATNVAEDVAIIAKSKGISYVEAFEQSPLKELVELKAKEESERSPVVTPSNRTKVDFKNLEDLGLKLASGKATEADQLRFTKELLKVKGIDLK